MCFVLPAVSEEVKTLLTFFSINVEQNNISRIDFCDIQNSQGLGTGLGRLDDSSAY